MAAVRRFRPDVVLCPDPTAVFFGQEYFNHRDHRVTGMAALDAVSPAAGLPHYFPDAGPAHQVADRAAVGHPRARRLGGHLRHGRAEGRRRWAATGASSPTATEWAATAVRLGAEDAGRQAGVPFAEGFRRLRLGG